MHCHPKFRLLFTSTMLRFTAKFLVFASVAVGANGSLGQEKTRFVTGNDGFNLEATLDLPPGMKPEQIKRAVILVHGSGAHSMDADLTIVTKENKPNLFFKELSESLTQNGFAVIRYNKRNFQIRKNAKQPETGSQADVAKRYTDNPVKHHVDDVLAAVKASQHWLPNAKVFLLGHSEGTYTSLQAADQTDQVAGVALIGFAQYSTDLLMYEQTVYRPLVTFRELDRDGNEKLTKDELTEEKPITVSLRVSMPILDVDKDGAMSMAEYQAGNFANLMVRDAARAFRVQEARYPRVSEILKKTKFKVAFFQGLWDNQTQAYHTMAVEILMRQLNKSDQMEFHYFPKLGHALDKRKAFIDIQFDTIDPAAKKKVGEALGRFFD